MAGTKATVRKPPSKTAASALPAGFTSPADRAADGKARRKAVPREDHAQYESPSTRTDPISIIDDQSSRRVPELVPIRYARMSESPFRFYRGAAAIMASDLADTPRTGLMAQICGDSHMLNFRLLASPERRLVFDINDFDETSPGPWEWDVKRLATSLVIAGRQNGFSRKIQRDIVLGAVRSYRESMRQFATMTNLEVWYTQGDVEKIQADFGTLLEKRGQKRLASEVIKARSRDTLQAFLKLTEEVDGQRRIVADPPFITPLKDLGPTAEQIATEEWFTALLDRYSQSLTSERRVLLSQYRFVEMARKVVGVGSVGTRCWIILMLGRDGQDPLMLQAKEAEHSVVTAHAGLEGKYSHGGERVVSGQRLMQASSDIFLGWDRVTGIDGKERDFYVRQLRDWKGVAVAEEMVPTGMAAFARLCGATLARAHARSGDQIAIGSYLGGSDVFDNAIAEFAEIYANQNERDHQALLDAVKSGRVQAADVAESSK